MPIPDRFRPISSRPPETARPRTNPVAFAGGCAVVALFVLGLDTDPMTATMIGTLMGALTMFGIALTAPRK
jgi:hypothetical protein